MTIDESRASMFQVRDSGRLLQFHGRLLSHATSWRRGSVRWVEFSLYRTGGGTYVLSRVGQTLIYHTDSCAVAARNNLSSIPSGALTPGHTPCPECTPDIDELAEVLPETPRNWAMVSETAEGVLEALYRYDAAGIRYLTSVAQRLLAQASVEDSDIAKAYQTETIA